jgi:hypothetical protein
MAMKLRVVTRQMAAMLLVLALSIQAILSPLAATIQAAADPLSGAVICLSSAERQSPDNAPQPLHYQCDIMCIATCRSALAAPVLAISQSAFAPVGNFVLVDNNALTEPQREPPGRAGRPQAARAPPIV